MSCPAAPARRHDQQRRHGRRVFGRHHQRCLRRSGGTLELLAALSQAEQSSAAGHAGDCVRLCGQRLRRQQRALWSWLPRQASARHSVERGTLELLGGPFRHHDDQCRRTFEIARATVSAATSSAAASPRRRLRRHGQQHEGRRAPLWNGLRWYGEWHDDGVERGTLELVSGAVSGTTTISSGGTLEIAPDTMSRYVVSTRHLEVGSGGTASNTSVGSGGTLELFGGAVANVAAFSAGATWSRLRLCRECIASQTSSGIVVLSSVCDVLVRRQGQRPIVDSGGALVVSDARCRVISNANDHLFRRRRSETISGTGSLIITGGGTVELTSAAAVTISGVGNILEIDNISASAAARRDQGLRVRQRDRAQRGRISQLQHRAIAIRQRPAH